MSNDLSSVLLSSNNQQVLSLLLFSVFALLVTLILIHILNPDKEPLPWREYCSVTGPPKTPPSLSPIPDTFVLDPSHPLPEFPPPDLERHAPVGILLGVFSTDQAVARRMMIRNTWARHPHSRNGAGEGDHGRGTSRTIVRFILGRPGGKWERQIQLEMESMYKGCLTKKNLRLTFLVNFYQLTMISSFYRYQRT